MDPQRPHPKTPRQQRRGRPRTRRTQRPGTWIGQGIASLVFDTANDSYQCYWLVGPAQDHLIDHYLAPSAIDAVEWARSRTSRARIRLPDHRTYWAGTDPTPGGFAGTWKPAHAARAAATAI
jgi:hypothetical protein